MKPVFDDHFQAIHTKGMAIECELPVKPGHALTSQGLRFGDKRMTKELTEVPNVCKLMEEKLIITPGLCPDSPPITI